MNTIDDSAPFKRHLSLLSHLIRSALFSSAHGKRVHPYQRGRASITGFRERAA